MEASSLACGPAATGLIELVSRTLRFTVLAWPGLLASTKRTGPDCSRWRRPLNFGCAPADSSASNSVHRAISASKCCPKRCLPPPDVASPRPCLSSVLPPEISPPTHPQRRARSLYPPQRQDGAPANPATGPAIDCELRQLPGGDDATPSGGVGTSLECGQLSRETRSKFLHRSSRLRHLLSSVAYAHRRCRQLNAPGRRCPSASPALLR